MEQSNKKNERYRRRQLLSDSVSVPQLEDCIFDPRASGWTTAWRSETRAASAQNFKLWQQATIEITRRDHYRRYHQEVQSTVHQVHKHC